MACHLSRIQNSNHFDGKEHKDHVKPRNGGFGKNKDEIFAPGEDQPPSLAPKGGAHDGVFAQHASRSSFFDDDHKR